MRGIKVALLCIAVLGGCGDDAAPPGTTAAASADDIASYCAVLEGAPERSSEETMAMLGEVALPDIADVIDRMLRYAGSGDDVTALADFNETTCGVRFP